jgi:Ca2+-binding EF-hand superfamily protein
MDKDNSNSLDKEELVDLCGHMNSQLNPRQLEVAMRDLDKNNDGSISMDEFLSWWVSDSKPSMPVNEHAALVKTQCKLLKDGPSLLRVGNSIAALGCVVGGCLGFINAIIQTYDNGFSIDQFIVTFTNLMLLVFAMVLLISELKAYLLGSQFSLFVEKHILFLDLLMGRAILQLYVGSIAAALYESNGGWGIVLLISLFSGLACLVFAVINILASIAMHSKLASLRSAMTSDAAANFATIDTNGDGKLDYDELHEYLKTSGITLTHREWEILMSKLDANGDGEVNFEEFSHWYSMRYDY